MEDPVLRLPIAGLIGVASAMTAVNIKPTAAMAKCAMRGMIVDPVFGTRRASRKVTAQSN